MGFPFSYKGSLKRPGDIPVEAAWFHDHFLEKAKEQFEVARAEVDLRGNALSFRTTLKAFPYWFNQEAASLAHIPKGMMYYEPAERRISYVLDFKMPVVIFTIGIIGLLGSFFVLLVKGPLLGRIAIVFFAWLIMTLVTYGGGILGFKRFLRRLLSEL